MWWKKFRLCAYDFTYYYYIFCGATLWTCYFGAICLVNVVDAFRAGCGAAHRKYNIAHHFYRIAKSQKRTEFVSELFMAH